MKKFMDRDFILSSEIAKKLYFENAANAPVLDYHCHINPAEIWEDRRFENITQLWLGGDHYKWRFMRSCGVEEMYITGNAPDHEKFLKWAECLGKAIGNPLYHWSHLELRKYFGYQGILNRKTAEEVWTHCNKMLADPSMSARGIIQSSGVTLICTTDDPADTLAYHQKLAQDHTFDVQVLPAWRPDKAMNLEKPGFPDYINQLEKASDMQIDSFDTLIQALHNRMDFFASVGCRVSDHGLEYVGYHPADDATADRVFRDRLQGKALSSEDLAKYKTTFMLHMGREYAARGWVMQLHYGCKRDNNRRMYESIGVDTGYDCINNHTPADQLADFLNALDSTNELPRTILYSLNPNDDQAIETIMGCFQSGPVASKIQHGSAWWFNDHKTGMINQLTSLANLGNLSGFVGMLTDSRSFLSYTRHDYFRRILCNLLGTWVDNGEFPEDYETLGEIVRDICYNNAVRYFGFDLDLI